MSCWILKCVKCYNSFLTLLIAVVRLIEAPYVDVEILHRLWGCVPAFSHVGYIAAPFYLHTISYNLNIDVNSRNILDETPNLLRE